MKTQLDMDKIARGLGAVRRGKVTASGGYFGAMQLMADIETRFRVPSGGGRSTNPRWTERRLVPLAPITLARAARKDLGQSPGARRCERRTDATRRASPRKVDRGSERGRGRASRSPEAKHRSMRLERPPESGASLRRGVDAGVRTSLHVDPIRTLSRTLWFVRI